MYQNNDKRRNSLFLSVAAAATVAVGVSLSTPAVAQQEEFTDWGWPMPYEQVSEESVTWLKEQGWWPLNIAFQAPWSGQNTVNIVIDRMDLMKSRGVETTSTAFASGPAINEVLVAGRYQVGSGGNFPFTSLIDRNIPVKAIAIQSPNLLHALVVPLDSPLQSFKDLKDSSPPASIGVVTGSSGEFYVQMAAQGNDVVVGEDITLMNMSPGDQMAMPRGIDAVAAWDPTVSMMVDELKNARIIDTVFSYNMYEGQFYVRSELIENVPDVVQALSDSFVEAVLWQRLYPEKAAALMKEDPNLRNYSEELLLNQVKLYSNLYKPTYVYPNAEFWGAVNGNIFNWLHESKRITRPLTAQDFVDAVDASFMDKTFEKLGWAIPEVPPFIPDGWEGQPDVLPYPEYLTYENLDEPQVFPEEGDLVRPWTFDGQTYTP